MVYLGRELKNRKEQDRPATSQALVHVSVGVVSGEPGSLLTF